MTLDYNSNEPIRDYDPHLYHTVESLAKLWDAPVTTIYYLLRCKRLKGFKAGKAWRIPDRARLEYELNFNKVFRLEETP